MVIYREEEGFSPAILTGNPGAFWLGSGRVSASTKGRRLVRVGGSAAEVWLVQRCQKERCGSAMGHVACLSHLYCHSVTIQHVTVS